MTKVMEGYYNSETPPMESPTFSATLNAGQYNTLYMTNALQPIEMRSVRHEGQEPFEMPVAGIIETDAATIWLTARMHEDTATPDIPDAITAYVVHEDSKNGVATVVKHKKIDPQANAGILYKDDAGTEIDIYYNGEGKGWHHQDSWRLDVYGKNSAKVTVSEATHPHVKHKTGRGWLKAIATGIGIVSSGPLATGAINFVENVNPAYHAAGDTREMLRNSDLNESSISNVAAIMAELQSGDKKAIVASAERYAQDEPDDIMTDMQRQTYLTQISTAHSNGEVLGALNNFMELYGKTAGPFTFNDQAPELSNFNMQRTSLNATKRVASSAVEAFSILPKSIVTMAQFDELTISNSSTEQGGMLAEVEEADGIHNIIGLAAESGLKDTLNAFGSQFVEGSGSAEWTALHELGHASQPNDQLEEESKPGGITGALEEAGLWWVGNPEYTSMYVAGATNWAEPGADTFAAATTPNSSDSNGLASPRSYVQFHSTANKKDLRRLAELDQSAGSGAAAWIVAHNSRLMGDDVLK